MQSFSRVVHAHLRSRALWFAAGAVLALSTGSHAFAQTEKVLHDFQGNVAGTADGYAPTGSLTVGPDGDFYGTAFSGGTGPDKSGGIVFKISKYGVYSIVHAFATDGSEGSQPSGGVSFDPHGNLYGTTVGGGKYSSGTVFKITPDGTESIVHSFGGTDRDGTTPEGGVVLDAAGNLYGTTLGGGGVSDYYYCGPNDLVCGTVFRITPGGQEANMHAFNPYAGEGVPPQSAKLAIDSSGNLYGESGGSIFKISTPNGPLSYIDGDYGLLGSAPLDGLILDSADNLYAVGRGPISGYYYSSNGSVFQYAPGGTITVVGSFPTSGLTANYYPQGVLAMDKAGNFYGTAYGYNGSVYSGLAVFEMMPTGALALLYRFPSDYGAAGVVLGQTPTGPLTLDDEGNLYGVVGAGGATGGGIVFEVTPVASPSTATTVTTSAASVNAAVAVTFTANVSWAQGNGIPADGEEVTFYDDTTEIGTGVLKAGVATYTTSSLLAGQHTIIATYGGDAGLRKSSGRLTQTVSLWPTTIAMQSSTNPSAYKQAVTLTAEVTKTSSNTLLGTVDFKSGVALLGIAPVDMNGMATLVTTAIPYGPDNALTATYNGDAINGKSVSAAVIQSVH